MLPDFISGNIYHFGDIVESEQVTIEIGKPCKCVKNGNETPVVLGSAEGDDLFILDKGDCIDFPSIGGYPDRFYIAGAPEVGTVISLAIQEFGDVVNPSYWEKKVII